MHQNSKGESVLHALLESGTISVSDVVTAVCEFEGDEQMAKLPKATYRESQNRWVMTIPAKYSDTGKRKPIYGTTEKEVIDKYRKEVVLKKKTVPTVEEYMLDVMNTYMYQNIEDTSYDRYENTFRGFVKGTLLGNKVITDVTGFDLTNFLKEVQNQDVSRQTLQILKILLEATFLRAKENGIVKDNVTEYMQLSTKRCKKQNPSNMKERFDECEIKRLINVVEKYCSNCEGGKFFNAPIFLIMLYTGLRLGEIMGLQTCNIDRENRKISITQQYVEGWERDEEGNRLHKKYYFKQPKTSAGVRTIPLTKKAECWFDIIEKTYKKMGITSEYVIVTKKSKTPTKSSVYATWKLLLKEANIEYRTPHKLRKSFVSIALDGGISLPQVSSMVGHKNSTTTINVYYKTIDSEYNQMKVAATLDRIIDNGWKIHDNTFDNRLTTQSNKEYLSKII